MRQKIARLARPRSDSVINARAAATGGAAPGTCESQPTLRNGLPSRRLPLQRFLDQTRDPYLWPIVRHLCRTPLSNGASKKRTPDATSSNGRHNFVCYLERGITDHPGSGTAKSCVREMAALGSAPRFRTMKTNALLRTTDEIRSYAQLQRQIHDALRVEHPEWVEANGDCPTCDSYESRLAELLGLALPKKNRSVA
jgi:hypothetical protein